MTDWIRVKWKAHGHHSTISARRFDESKHTLLDRPACDPGGKPLPPKYQTFSPSPSSWVETNQAEDGHDQATDTESQED